MTIALKYRLYSASDFKDAIKYFEKDLTQSVDQEDITPEARALEKADLINRKIKPKIRDVKVYQQIMDGG